MERWRVRAPLFVDVAKGQHLFEALFPLDFKPAARRTNDRVFQRPEKRVPDWQVGKVIRVAPELMMNTVRLRTLHNKTEPTWSADIPVVEKLRDRGEQGADRRRLRAASEDKVNERAAQQGIEKNLDGMLVKAGHDLDPARGVMQLMTDPPEELRFVAVTMPPVVNEG